MGLYKDEGLDRLAQVGNVAQFVAFRPDATGGLRQSTARVEGLEPNAGFDSVEAAVATLLSRSADSSVNVRSYQPEDPRSREFVYGIKDPGEAVGHLRRLAAQGLFLILNETIDVADGGVSGVAQGDLIEFAPDDTPRTVEKPGAASLERDLGLSLLKRVYGFAPDLPGQRSDRIEFSLHPQPRGWRGTHTLLWEVEAASTTPVARPPSWPNKFSRHIGDKVFGLLVAEAVGARVPLTTVVGRRVPPFTFGSPTGYEGLWLRTAPLEPEPGLFTTVRGWRDPFALLLEEDPNKRIASVLAQKAVRARYSGAAIVGGEGDLIIEGRSGEGDGFMVGRDSATPLPDAVADDVLEAHRKIADALGPVRIEWVHDGEAVWVVQLHVGQTRSTNREIVPGDAERWVDFDPASGLGALRHLLGELEPGTGVTVNGPIGLTSHLADLLRRWSGPSRFGLDPSSGDSG
jgi:hypothetical protein